MRTFSPSSAVLLTLVFSSTLGIAQQTAPAADPPTATAPDAAVPPAAEPKPPILGPDGKALPALTPVKGGKLEKKKKEKSPKLYPVNIVRGVLTVDGWAGRAALNYDIPDFKFLYISTPGLGTTVVSNAPFVGGKEEPEAFKDNSLVVKVDGHVLELASDNRIMGKKPQSAWVMLDKTYTYPSTYPTVGYGYDDKAPYLWPGSKANATVKGIAASAPPLPANLRPVVVAKPCMPVKPGPALAQPNPQGLPPCVAPPKPVAAPAAVVAPAEAVPVAPATTAAATEPPK